ncbi:MULTISPECIES: hypothetical protein [Microbacterium]|jgi:hypothetical protein|uniref:hypothetical protein n=1 Tax=Microbacterium TaxID=33882 RepID=UPI0002588B96|nr:MULTISPECIES: hypothetical protein [Microbacterium]EIC07037.1 hypothetical protein OR221_2920 [Microbacterium laevaniformans OR221]HAM12439.1 hypothetical protein [Microbacterium sp.]MCC4250424.1 hypothetical protein [Microbacterium testaceum]MDX2401331.1 hypothetical protein [Microbacterium algeriense]QXE31697.1 hypothetical protein IZR02_17070 [Microbacterium paraoxydans]|tara:strand:- start:16568 stop:16813 length:246 start_codon:yes stop_codon:yes gene_type:complete
MLSDEVARQIIHGSPEGYDLGCQTRAGCANHHHPTLMTCFAAAIAVRDDWRLAKLPRNEPLPKSARRLRRSSPRSKEGTPS